MRKLTIREIAEPRVHYGIWGILTTGYCQWKTLQKKSGFGVMNITFSDRIVL